MNKGFSLIELISVLAIIGIMAAITYPSYNDYLTRTRRLDGQTALIDLANRLEQFHAHEFTYQTATIAHHTPRDVLSQTTSPGHWYTLSIRDATKDNYLIAATPIGPQSTADTRCQTLTLTNTGIEGITEGPSGAPIGSLNQCW